MTPTPSNHTARRLLGTVRQLLLLAFILTSPALCCGATLLIDSLPSAWLPDALDFTFNLFESEIQVENHTGELLTVTAITTAYGKPDVIEQNINLRQRDIPIEPDGSVMLTYDAADAPLAGIVVCRANSACGLLARGSSSVYAIESFDALEPLEKGWMEAVQASPHYNSMVIGTIFYSLFPIAFLGGWMFVGWLQKRNEMA